MTDISIVLLITIHFFNTLPIQSSSQIFSYIESVYNDTFSFSITYRYNESVLWQSRNVGRNSCYIEGTCICGWFLLYFLDSACRDKNSEALLYFWPNNCSNMQRHDMKYILHFFIGFFIFRCRSYTVSSIREKITWIEMTTVITQQAVFERR